MTLCKYMTALLLAVTPAWAGAVRIDLVEFGRVVEMTEESPQPTTSVEELVRGSDGWDAVRGPDGQFTIGVEWDEPRDISEVNIEFRHAIASREQIKVQYWKDEADGKPTPTTEKSSKGRWLTPKTDWWAGDRDVSFALLPEDKETAGRNESGKSVRRTTRIRFVCGKEDLPPVRYLRAYGPDPTSSDTFDVRISESGPATPVSVHVVNGFVLAGDGKTRMTSSILRDRVGALTLVYARTASTAVPNATKVSLGPVEDAAKQVSFYPAEVAWQGRMILAHGGVTIERRGGKVASPPGAIASQPSK